MADIVTMNAKPFPGATSKVGRGKEKPLFEEAENLELAWDDMMKWSGQHLGVKLKDVGAAKGVDPSKVATEVRLSIHLPLHIFTSLILSLFHLVHESYRPCQ